MTQRPQLECPNCGSDRVLPLVYGFPGEELLDMATQGFVALGGGTMDGNESTWSCRSCHHKWGSVANAGDRDLREAVFARIDSVFVPTPPEARRAAMREQCFQEFVDTVVPQAVGDGASAIQLEGMSLVFVIEGEPVLVAPIPWADDVIGAFRDEIEGDGSPSKATGAVTVNVYALERRVELGLARTEGGGLEISLLGHDLPGELLAEVAPRPRLPVCPYCGEAVRTKMAKQCFECGMDWRDPGNT